MPVLVDTNVLLDVATEDAKWCEWSAARLARGGVKRSPLPDFYISAHAALEGFPLLTRDARRYREYFPSLELIAPDRRSRTASTSPES